MTNLVRSPTHGYYLSKLPLKTLAASLGQIGDFPFKNPETVQYKGPTLIVRGTKSRYVADDILPLVGRFFPNFILYDIDAGHWVISERPQAFDQGTAYKSCSV